MGPCLRRSFGSLCVEDFCNQTWIIYGKSLVSCTWYNCREFLALQNNIVGCKAFISTPLEIAGAALANVFHEVRLNFFFFFLVQMCSIVQRA